MYILRARFDLKCLCFVLLLILYIGQWSNADEVDNKAKQTITSRSPEGGVRVLRTKLSESYQTTESSDDHVIVSGNKTVAPITQVPLLEDQVVQVSILGNTTGKKTAIIPADEKYADVFQEPERMMSEHDIKNLTIDNHRFYESSFVGNNEYFSKYWGEIGVHNATTHAVLSNSHRRATSIKLSFAFPFYGHYINNVTVATGGFVYTGEHVHNWLAATQYIAPLMANFDTRLTNDSLVKVYDDGEKFTVFWVNVTLQESLSKKFTFAVTLYKNGTIIFAYKDIPMDIQEIQDKEHPVKVGISDAYLMDSFVFYVRRKTIYEYHRVSFTDHFITSNTMLILDPLPTCLPYKNCRGCLNHVTGFNCSWCPQTQKCSSGTDWNKQDFFNNVCDRTPINTIEKCSLVATDESNEEEPPVYGKPVFVGHVDEPYHDHVLETVHKVDQILEERRKAALATTTTKTTTTASPVPPKLVHHAATGGLIAASIVIILLISGFAWGIYAFRNPHTPSGQWLIKYRPNQWNAGRAEARYTPATIHI